MTNVRVANVPNLVLANPMPQKNALCFCGRQTYNTWPEQKHSFTRFNGYQMLQCASHRLYQPSLPERSLPMASYSVPPAMNSAQEALGA